MPPTWDSTGGGIMKFKRMMPVTLCLSLLSIVGAAQTSELGKFENGQYRNFATDVEVTVPDGWTFMRDVPSTGNGQMAIVESNSNITVQIWMKSHTVEAADIVPALHLQMENKHTMRPEGWTIRPDSAQNRIISRHRALSSIADYTLNSTPMVEYDLWVLSGNTAVLFFGQAQQDELQTLQADLETVASTTRIP
jgi:hypothetical protein